MRKKIKKGELHWSPVSEVYGTDGLADGGETVTVRATHKVTDEKRLAKYLSNMTNEEVGLSSEHAREVRKFWLVLNIVVGSLKLPIAMPGGKLGFKFIWNSDKVNITTEIGDDGTFDWFFRDKRNDTVLSSENEKLPNFPAVLCHKLYLHFCAS